ncbi:MAG: hypothetical protein ACLTDV_06800 [Eubacterium sp.]
MRAGRPVSISDLHATDDLTLMLNALVRRLVMGFLIMALLISSVLYAPQIWNRNCWEFRH